MATRYPEDVCIPLEGAVDDTDAFLDALLDGKQFMRAVKQPSGLHSECHMRFFTKLHRHCTGIVILRAQISMLVTPTTNLRFPTSVVQNELCCTINATRCARWKPQ